MVPIPQDAVATNDMKVRLLRFTILLFASLVAVSSHSSAEPRPSVALISDFHFNPFDPPELAKELVNRPVEEWPEIFGTIERQGMSKWGSDTNYALFASSLEAFSQSAAGADFAIMAGDFLAHKFEEKMVASLKEPSTEESLPAFSIKTTLFVGDAISRAFAGKPVIVALGNTDSGCGDYGITPGGSYLAGTRDMVRRMVGEDLIGDDFDETYAAGGYYALRHPTVPNSRILVLNNILWSAKYHDRCSGSVEAAAMTMRRWLRKQLEDQKSTGGSVWVIQHIPWGVDTNSTLKAKGTQCREKIVPFLKENDAAQLHHLIREYSTTVQTSFAGHVHTDDYRLLQSPGSQPLIAQKILPAISPIYNQNPGFSIMTYDAKTGAPLDFSTYHLTNLDSASLTEPGYWRFEYDFADEYGFERYSAESIAEIVENAGDGGERATTYRRLYELGHGQMSEEDLPAYACAMKNLSRQEFSECFCGD